MCDQQPTTFTINDQHTPPIPPLAKGRRGGVVVSRQSSVVSYQRESRGFSLIETIVALFVLTLGVMGAFIVVSRAIHISPSVRQELIAANLAQEAIEGVRNIRDKRLLIIADGIKSGGNPSRNWAQDIEACQTNGSFRTLFQLTDVDVITSGYQTDCRGGAGPLGQRPEVYRDLVTGYYQNACQKAGGGKCKDQNLPSVVVTGFRRVLNTEKYVGATLDNLCGPVGQPMCTEVRIKVKVYWGTNTEPLTCPGENCVLLEDRLTNWVDYMGSFL